MSDSILTSTKKVLGIAEDYTAFDVDILMHINSVFATLNQLGVGPNGVFMVEDVQATWDEFLTKPVDDDPANNTVDYRFNSVKTYVYLKVRILFDPPTTSYLIESFRKQAEELEWRLNVVREEDAWVDPFIEEVEEVL